MTRNNENKEPSMEECAASVARLADHMELLDPVILRPFVEEVMKKVKQGRQEMEAHPVVMLIGGKNGNQHEQEEGRST